MNSEYINKNTMDTKSVHPFSSFCFYLSPEPLSLICTFVSRAEFVELDAQL